MNTSYGPVALIAVTMIMAIYAATTAGPDQQTTSKSSEGTQTSASAASSAGAQTSSSPARNGQEGTPQGVWEELKEAGQETADIFTDDNSGQQAKQDNQGEVADVWEELKEAGHQTVQIFADDEESRQASAGGSQGQPYGAQGQASAGGSQGQAQLGGSGQASASRGQSAQRSVKVYNTQGQELGAISAIVIDREDEGVRAIVVDRTGEASASSNRVDEKLRSALCGDGAQLSSKAR